MNKPKVAAEEYIHFLVASPAAVSGTEAARVHAGPLVAHDAYARLLHRLEPDAAALWQEARGLVTPTRGVLVLDATTLDNPYAQHMGPVTRHWSGKHRAVVQGINLLTRLWGDGQALVPVDYRLYDKATDELTKNDHFQHLLRAARQRGFAPCCVLFDSWYASLANLKQVRALGWPWPTRLKRNRRVNPDGQGLRPRRDCALAAGGRRVWLRGSGFVHVFRFAAPDGGTEGAEYWASSDPDLPEAVRAPLAALAWGIEQHHRGLKQCCGVEKAQAHAFLRLETQRLRTGRSWYEAKKHLPREAIQTHLANPAYILHPATA